MRVQLEPVEGTQIQRLTVVDSGSADVHVGEVVGYRCPECDQADESLRQIWHEAECSLAGKHGRAHYDELEPTLDAEETTPELRPEHEITIVKYNDGWVIGFKCDSCHNADETLGEIVHDEVCGLAGRHGRASSTAMSRSSN